MSANTSETNKRQKVNDDVNMDDLFEEETCCGPTIVSQRPVGDGGVVAPDTSLKIPEGSKLAYNPGSTNSIKAIVLAATPKTNTSGPTSIKLTCQILSVKNCTDISARYGLPPLTFIYDGFLQLHVEGNGAGTSQAVKRDAESALKDYFKSPIYLTEKAFYDPSDEDGGIDEDMIISPAGGEGVEERTA